MENNNSEVTIKKCIHHDRTELCTSRPPYRQGRKLTAVKVSDGTRDCRLYPKIICQYISYFFLN